jgi:hypothetical protein
MGGVVAYWCGDSVDGPRHLLTVSLRFLCFGLGAFLRGPFLITEPLPNCKIFDALPDGAARALLCTPLSCRPLCFRALIWTSLIEKNG